MRLLRPDLIALAWLSLTGCATAPLRDFERNLAANESATAALGQWCSRNGLAKQPVIRALVDRDAVVSASPEVRAELGITNGATVGYRHVRLVCGERTLSVAHNWFVPELLTPDMNHTLATTDVPFGKVVAPLGFHRKRLAERRGRMAECPSGTVLSHRAALFSAEGRAISLVIECYTHENF